MVIDMSIKETGISEARLKISNFVTRFPNEVAKALVKEAELTMTESKRECPVDTGALRASGFVESPVITSKRVSIKLGYGGKSVKINPKTRELTTSYGIKVHENAAVPHRVG
jgi:hypothetical protein